MIKVILLAAGLSKRMKSENKLIKLYKNKHLINYSLNVLKKIKKLFLPITKTIKKEWPLP